MGAETVKVNDFAIHVATVNGSGSQSSNNVLMRSIFRMGIPVGGKNLFPSNIQGLPTWFTIRVNKDGWVARKVASEILICMNDQTYVEDVKALEPGAFVIHHDHMNIEAIRKDVVSISVPFSKLIAEACPEARLRKLAVNMVYVGVVAEFLGITDEAIGLAMAQQFKTKQKVIDLNKAALAAGRNYVKSSLSHIRMPLKVEAMDGTQGKILIEGNAAAALGAIFAGCSVVSWYPITPSTSLVDFFQEFSERFRVDPQTKEKNFAILQAEDELAAIGMVLGASWMGARAMTATSGPGISLMSEFIGYAYFAEIPAVVVDVQRVGPSTGLPTRTAQGDVLFAATLGHGDTKHLLLFPGNVREVYEFTAQAFDLAERFQTPVLVMSDLDLGMNFHMADPFPYLSKAPDRGKVLTDEDGDKLATWMRYGDPDGDGIPYRTLPGMKDPRGVYFTRGSGHNAKAAYTEKGSEYVEVMNRLSKKFETAKAAVPQPILTGSGTQKIGVIAYGSSDDPMLEALHLLKKEYQLSADYLRVRAFPFSGEVEKFIAAHEIVYVVEQNRDAQMASLLRMEASISAHAGKLKSIVHFDGLPIHARLIANQIFVSEESRKNLVRVA